MTTEPPAEKPPAKTRFGNPPIAERFTISEDRSYNGTPCHRWSGAHSAKGYGRLRDPVTRKTYWAHRWFWIQAYGEPADPTLTLDHLCSTRDCVNVLHLELVTRRENTLRGWKNNATIRSGLTGVCVSGRHLLEGDNLGYRVNKGGRAQHYCKECKRERQARYFAESKAARQAALDKVEHPP